MKINSNFLTHESNGEHYIISTSATSFNGLVKSNETAAFIIDCLKSETSEQEIINKILNEYEVTDKAKVENDVVSVIEKLRSIGALDE